jgi:hypothetical protein
MKILLILIAILFSFTAQAAELRMDTSVCQQVTRHVPDASVAYQPGVDANGKKVAPADINASPLNNTLINQVAIKLENDTAATFGLKSPTMVPPGGGAPVPLVQGTTEIGYVTFKDNKAYLNGKPLDAGQQDQLAVLCIQREKR